METAPQSTSVRNTLIWRGIAIFAFAGHLLLLWVSILGFQDKVEIFYWQRFSDYLLALRFLTFLIIPVSIWFSSKASSRIWLVLLGITVYCLVLSYLNFGSIFYSTWIKHIGTLELMDNVYQFTEVAKFDDPTIYYIGVCEKKSLVCEFHEVYRVSPLSEFAPEVMLSDSARQLILMINGEMVYNFDGIHETCVEGEYGHCLINYLEE